MQLLEGISGLRMVPSGAVMSIGNFDGLHRGHSHLMETCRAHKAAGATAIVIVTFEPHPLTVLRPAQAPPRLTTWAQKQKLLSALGADVCVVLPPTRELLNMTADEFWQVVRDDARPSCLIEGADFTFGKARGGNIPRLREWCRGTGIQLEIASSVKVPLLDLSIVPVSSTLIRWLLRQGRARDAAIALGRAYALEGEVIHGFARGRTIGVPTANLACVNQLICGDGVYVGRCQIDGTIYPAALSIGSLPTFNERAHQVEAHLIGYQGDLYGKLISVEVVDWLREQRRYSGIDALKRQIDIDLIATKKRYLMDASRAIARVA